MGFDVAGVPAARWNPVAHADAEDGDASFVLWMVAGVFGLVLAFIGIVFWLIGRGGRAATDSTTRKTDPRIRPPPDPAEVAALLTRTDAAAATQLVAIEHALRLGEHADLRSQLDHATRIEQTLRALLAQAATGDPHTFRKAGRMIADLEESANRATRLAEGGFRCRGVRSAGRKGGLLLLRASARQRRVPPSGGGQARRRTHRSPRLPGLCAGGEKEAKRPQSWLRLTASPTGARRWASDPTQHGTGRSAT